MLILLVLAVGCTEDPVEQPLTGIDQQLSDLLTNLGDEKGKDYFRLPDSDEYGKIPQDPQNPLTPAKIELGKMLFHETALSVNPKNEAGRGTYSCASCHHMQGGFQACLPQGIGDGGVGFGTTGQNRIPDLAHYATAEIDVQPLRTPSALNIAYQENVLWNGQFGAGGKNEGTEDRWTINTPIATNFYGYQGPEVQAIAGLTVHRMEVTPDLLTVAPEYESMFAEAFPELAADARISNVTAALAIAAYERTLLASASPFQLWIRGNTEALSLAEKEGAMLFFGEANCVTCHTGPALSSMEFHAIGAADLMGDGVSGFNPEAPAHLGRGGFTGNTEDNFKFKVPQLYNLTNSPFYGHGASFTSVRDVVEYKNEAVSENNKVPSTQLAAEFQPLGLTDEQMQQITLFIESSLNDPSLSRFLPDYLPSGQCFPNNDAESKGDLDCL